ncbi:MAG: HNH endonuclease [Proteobacteria bacterium]|nr:HNH endonuclease [Pseudomonadota bacterium]
MLVRRRHRLVAAQQGRCWYCRIALSEAPRTDTSATIEHIIPRCAGGTMALHNVVAACQGCNRARGVMLAHSYRDLVRRRGREKAQDLARRWNMRHARREGLRLIACRQHAALIAHLAKGQSKLFTAATAG